MRPTYTSNDENVESEEVKDATTEVEGEPSPAETSPAETTETDESEETEEATEEESEETGEATETASADEETKAVTALAAQKADLLKDIEDLRATRRQERTGNAPILVPTPKKEETADLSDISEKDVVLVERILKAKGYVKKDEISTMTYTERMEAEKDKWLDEHPEYKPTNDPDDKRWNALNGVLREYYKAPTNPKDIRRVLDSAHRDLNPASTPPVKSKASVDAANEKTASSSKSSGGAGATTSGKKNQIDLSGLQGFTQEELDEFLK